MLLKFRCGNRAFAGIGLSSPDDVDGHEGVYLWIRNILSNVDQRDLEGFSKHSTRVCGLPLGRLMRKESNKGGELRTSISAGLLPYTLLKSRYENPLRPVRRFFSHICPKSLSFSSLAQPLTGSLKMRCWTSTKPTRS